MIKKILCAFLCVVLCGCSSAETTDASEKNEIEGSPYVGYIFNSPEEVERFLTFIDSDSKSDGIYTKDDNGYIYYEEGLSFPNSFISGIKKTVAIAGYPFFDENYTPESYYINFLYPWLETNESKNYDHELIPHYECTYVMNGIRYRVNSYLKYAYDTDWKVTSSYSGIITFDKNKALMYENEKNCFMFYIDFGDEYRTFFTVSSANSEKLTIDDINFDGVHLFK